MKKQERIFLKENTVAFDGSIRELNQSYDKGVRLLKMLNNLGLNLKTVEDWETDVIAPLTTDYPKATLHFNLQAKGLDAVYNEALTLYNKKGFRFSPVSSKEIDEIRETCTQYATTPQQIEAYHIIHNVIKDMNRLKEIGLFTSYDNLYTVDRVWDAKGVNNHYLTPHIMRIK
jgi:hypothetical protein